MSASIVDAILNLVDDPVTHLVREYAANNRANDAGSALEEYVKDLFAGTFNLSPKERLERISRTFSYTGNNSNPPDAMLWGGDAIEVKKIEKPDAALALNSSYPKHVLCSTSDLISDACQNAEKWSEKDMLYVVGTVKNNILKQLVMVYGLDYCASETCYLRLKQRVQDGINHIDGVDFSATRELGRVNKVDPLGITYMRIRGMWGIENPVKVFDYIYHRDESKSFNFMCIINSEKWSRLPRPERLMEKAAQDTRLIISDELIKDPDNPARTRKAKLIKFSC